MDRMENADLSDLDEGKRKHLQYGFLLISSLHRKIRNKKSRFQGHYSSGQ